MRIMIEEEEKPQRRLTDEEIAILKNIVERERAISWLGKSAKYIAGWILVVFGAWALFSKAVIEWIQNNTGVGM
jgi:hypothetical protein